MYQSCSAAGLITGAADDDPSGIATYSQAGAQFGEERADLSDRHAVLGEIDEHPVCPGLLLVTLPRRHALDLIHPPPRRTCAVAKPLDSLQPQRFGQTADQACDDADHIP